MDEYVKYTLMLLKEKYYSLHNENTTAGKEATAIHQRLKDIREAISTIEYELD